MAAKRKTPKTRLAVSASSVDEFMSSLSHPLKPEIEAARRTILTADTRISEAVKWNAPSFKTSDFFATVHLRSTQTLQVVFHMGAKAKATAKTGVSIDVDPALIRWLGKDRCLVTLGAGAPFKKNLAALKALTKQWVTYL